MHMSGVCNLTVPIVHEWKSKRDEQSYQWGIHTCPKMDESKDIGKKKQV